jgi:hypothetical protein
VEEEIRDFISLVEDFARCVVVNLRDRVECIIYYPHPFSLGGVVIVLKDDAQPFIELISQVYSCARLNLSIHCLRRSELFKLSLPGIFSLPRVVSEHLHLPFWLKHRGAALYGCDLRDEIGLAVNPRHVLELHIEACQHAVRSYYIIQYLVGRQYSMLIEQLDRQIRYLMASALLMRDVWDVSMETIPQTFILSYDDQELKRIWEQFALLGQNGQSVEASRETAFEAAWLFESFLRRLRTYAI